MVVAICELAGQVTMPHFTNEGVEGPERLNDRVRKWQKGPKVSCHLPSGHCGPRTASCWLLSPRHLTSHIKLMLNLRPLTCDSTCWPRVSLSNFHIPISFKALPRCLSPQQVSPIFMPPWGLIYQTQSRHHIT